MELTDGPLRARLHWLTSTHLPWYGTVCGCLHGRATKWYAFSVSTSFDVGPIELKRVGSGNVAKSKALIGTLVFC